MTDNNQLIKELTAKDEQKAFAAACEIINSANVEAFQILAEKSEFSHFLQELTNSLDTLIQKGYNKTMSTATHTLCIART